MREDYVHFKVCTLHYMLGSCICPSGLCYHNEPFGFGSLSLCKKALRAIGDYIPQEVKNLHVCIHVFATLLWSKKQFCCLCFLCKSEQRTRHWSRMWICRGKNIALLGLHNQRMAQIPLSQNTLASQLIINGIFFFFFVKSVFFFHVNWCWAGGGQNGVNAAIVRPSCPCWKASALPTRTSQRLMLSQLWKRERQFFSAEVWCSVWGS